MEVKKATTYREQVEKIEQRGCCIENVDDAIRCLESINYYRLSAYFLPFRKDDGSYNAGTSFSRIVQIYEFDRLLRRSLFSALEEIEISMRAKLAYFHAHKYSPVGYLDASIYSRSHKHQKFLDTFNREVGHSSNVPFVKHHIDCYNGVFPIWVAVELFPVVELDYPNYPVNVEHLGGDNWRFVIDLSSEVLLPKSSHPNKDGYQIRLHYYRYDEDWNHRYDYSADYNVGYPNINDKIVVYDLEDNILWGVPPSLPKETTTIAKKSVNLTFVDAGKHENNVFKPEFTVVNTGSAALKNYKIRGYISAPKGCCFNVPIDDWYTPESTPSLTNIAENIWMLEIVFDEHILYPGQSVFSGNIGIHLRNWNEFDKSLLGLVVVDENGEILWGTPWNGSGVVLNQEYANVQR